MQQRSSSKRLFGSSHNRESLRCDPSNGWAGYFCAYRAGSACHSSNIVLNFGYFPVANKSSLLFLVCTQIFGNFSLRISAPSIFLLLEFSTEWFALRNLTIFGFSGNLWRKFLCHLPLFLNLCSMESTLNATGNSGNVGSNGKRPSKTLEAPSTLIRFQTKTELFSSVYGYRPHYNAENDHQKRSHSKSLSRVERFENDAFLETLFSIVDGENDVIWQRWRHQKRHDQAPNHSTVSIQNDRQALPCSFNFAGRYIEMRMCRDYLSMRTESIKAFSKRYENDKCGRKSFWKRSKTATFSFEDGALMVLRWILNN